MRVAGVMSGTSLDGIDVAIVEIRGRRIETIGFQTTAYPRGVRDSILALDRPGGLSYWNFQLAELYARAVLRATKKYGPVELIGCHGQTVYHEGGRHTLQIGEPAVLAERTGVPVVSNFRARDIAAGGQGAPLAPYVDYLLFRHPSRTRVALNIGGIANITIIPPAGRLAARRAASALSAMRATGGEAARRGGLRGPQPPAPAARPRGAPVVVAFDTGPGNMVIDALAREHSGGKSGYDRGGKIAESGKVNPALLDELLADSYYRRQPPKSAGREQYGADFVTRLKRPALPMEDLVATATVLTAATIAMGVSRSGCSAGDLIVSGGGVHNPQIMCHLAGFLPGFAISTSSDHGIDADAKEAIAFAVLAAETWRRRPSNLPSATGARRAVVLGSITP